MGANKTALIEVRNKSGGIIKNGELIILGHDMKESITPLPMMKKILEKQKTDEIIIHITKLNPDDFVRVHEAIEKELKRRGLNDRL